MDNTRNVTFTGNFVGDVAARKIDWTGMTVDKEACITVGGYGKPSGGTPNHDLKFQNNIAAGCVFAGMVIPADDTCSTTSTTNVIKNNIAHSSNRVGIYAYVNPISTTSSTCVEWGYASAYKTQEACAVSVMLTPLQKAHHITCIDVEQGLSANYGG